MSNTSFKNASNLGLTLAAWLTYDTYDHNPKDAPDDGLPIISATSLLKPTKALILGHKVPKQDAVVEISDLVKSRVGQAVHALLEEAILEAKNNKELLNQVGIPNQLLERMVINPTDQYLKENPQAIPAYIEQRFYRLLETSSGYKIWISGKADQIIGGSVEDNKTTSTYKYIKLDPTEIGEYSKQQSIYRWLAPTKVTSDVGKINFIFTDWKAGDVGRIPSYPTKPAMEVPINLMSLADTEAMLIQKIEEIRTNLNVQHQDDMVRCDESELWKAPDVYKYYASEETALAGGRASKNFTSHSAAMLHQAQKNKGVVRVVPGEVKRCSYCDAAPICTQRLEYQSE